MKIVLLGYMGCGKSTVGQTLSQLTNYDFIDLDEYIEQNEHTTVSKIFENKGESHFRTLETRYLNLLLKNKTNGILSLGGGTPCYNNNMSLIHQHTVLSVYLKCLAETLVIRLRYEKSKRPLISHLSDNQLLAFIQNSLLERVPYYTKARCHIAMDGLSVLESAKKIFNQL